MLVFAMQFSQTNHSQTLPAPTTEPTPKGAMLQAAPGTKKEPRQSAFPQNGTENERPTRNPENPQATDRTNQCANWKLQRRHDTGAVNRRTEELLRKEVIQPHLPVRLPCYDFTPIADPTFGSSPPYGLGH